MSFASISRFYMTNLNSVKPKYIFQKCKVLKINNDMSCYISCNFKKYKLYLKGVPKVKILKNYLKYLCTNERMYIKVLMKDEIHYENQYENIEENQYEDYEDNEESHCQNIPNIVGSLFTSDKINVNILLVNRFNYLKKKYIYERIVLNSFYKKKKNKNKNLIIGQKKQKLRQIKKE